MITLAEMLAHWQASGDPRAPYFVERLLALRDLMERRA